MKKEAAVVLKLREELENAHQEGAKSLESAQAKEAKLIDEVKELRNETENLKVCHFSALLERRIDGYASDRKGETDPRVTGPRI